MREHTIPPQTPVVLNTGTAGRQLGERRVTLIMLYFEWCEMTTWDRMCKKAYPVCSTEVNSFSKVISLIEATVVGSREGDDKLPSTLVGTYNLSMSNTELNQRKVLTTNLISPVCMVLIMWDWPVHRETWGYWGSWWWPAGAGGQVETQTTLASASSSPPQVAQLPQREPRTKF